MSTVELAKRWTTLAGQFTSDEENIARIWRVIREAYCAPARHYHTLAHLQNMFAATEELAATIGEPDAFAFAIYFHDIVYDVSKRDNEHQSANVAERLLRDIDVPAPTRQRTLQLIEATAHGSGEPLPEDDPDLALLLDVDLAILAADRETYQKYASAIRAEYALFPDAQYYAGRAAVLEHFIAQPKIYRLEKLRAMWEQPARDNLNAELQQLMSRR